jgi:hypothetical protein
VSRLDRFSVAMIVLAALFVAWVARQPRAPLSPAWQVESPVTSILQCSDGIRRVTWMQNIGSYEIGGAGWTVTMPSDVDLGYTCYWGAESDAKLAAQKGCE